MIVIVFSIVGAIFIPASCWFFRATSSRGLAWPLPAFSLCTPGDQNRAKRTPLRRGHADVVLERGVRRLKLNQQSFICQA